MYNYIESLNCESGMDIDVGKVSCFYYIYILLFILNIYFFKWDDLFFFGIVVEVVYEGCVVFIVVWFFLCLVKL